MRGTGTSRDPLRACAHPGRVHPPIIDHPSSTINPRAFTLIELLVAISIIALLLSLLMPSLQRVRKQVKATGCRANLHQWAIAYETYAAENDGYLPPAASHGYRGPNNSHSDLYDDSRWDIYFGSPWPDDPMQEDRLVAIPKGLRLCPMAAKRERWKENWMGGTFLAWEIPGGPPDSRSWSSYTTNYQVHSWWGDRFDPRCPADFRFMWMASAVKNAATVPVFLDSMWLETNMYDDKSPPAEYDAIPTREIKSPSDSFCINRHEGGINSLFMDWSVRKVGLKELWTLKWWSQYNTRGPWTKAGAVKPEDWPQWMRGFKDY
jgi:prepilin-type N-terminal cleavage/methylation domain-containing protein/prepilin-type processing-associated H-X9-DG protein